MGKNNQMQGWIPCSERLPEDFVDVLTVDEYGNIHLFHHYSGYKKPFNIDNHDYQFYPPTHWMPLPQPPKGEIK